MALAASMTVPTEKFNKDGKMTCVRDSKKDLICIIDPALMAEIETGLYSMSPNLVFIDLRQRFVKVVEMVMGKDIKVMLVDKRAVGAPLTINKTYTKFEEGNMCTYIFNHI